MVLEFRFKDLYRCLLTLLVGFFMVMHILIIIIVLDIYQSVFACGIFKGKFDVFLFILLQSRKKGTSCETF